MWRDRDPYREQQYVRDREAALALGIRVAVHDSRQNDPNPSSGSPARTTGPPTPSTPPAASWSAPAVARSGPAPNANHHYKNSTSEQH